MNIDIMTLTQEDIDAIVKSREERARKAKIHHLIDTFNKTLDELKEMGVVAHLPAYGGGYEKYTIPYLDSFNVQFDYK